MRKPVKEVLARLNIHRPEINLTRLLLVVLPTIVVLIVSLVSVNLPYNNVIAATENYAVYVAIDAVDIADNVLIRTDAANVADNVLIRTDAANVADIVVIRSAVGNTVEVLIR